MIPGIMNQAYHSALGNVERAVIEIVDYNTPPVSQPDVTPARTGDCAAGACVSCLKKKKRSAAAAVCTVAGSSKAAAASVFQAGHAVPAAKKRYLVQFNPAELTLMALGSDICPKGSVTMQKNGRETSVQYGVLDMKIRLTVKLIFDQVNVQDSFLWEKFRLDPTNLLTGAVKGIANAATGKEYTVQTETEGFLAALRNRNRRGIAFYWGDLCYRGILSSVESEYQMFSVSGKPVRARVTLGIDCTNENVGQNSLGEWESYYQKVFAGANSRDMERGVQNVSNLFHLGF